MIVTGASVKSSVARKLLENFPAVKVYNEANSRPAYPHFFVYQVSFVDGEQRRGTHLLDYSLDVRYRVASDPSTNLELQRSLDEMAMMLSQAMDFIDFGEVKLKCVEKSPEKEDGVLHFFFHVKIIAREIDSERRDKMGELTFIVRKR